MVINTVRHLILVGTLLIACSSPAGTVRISFLNDEGALQETAKLLKTNGCSEGGVALFQKAVKRYYSVPLDLDLSKFPPAQNGAYSFQSTTQLVAALPHPLRLTQHQWDINCYDTVIVVSAGQLQAGSHPDDITGVFLAPAITTNFSLVNQPVATARDAFNFSVPAWYRENSEIIPPSMTTSRMSLTAALYSNYILPVSTTEGNLPEVVLKTLQASWKRQAITFPSNFEVVLCYGVYLPGQQVTTLHAGMLFAKSKGLMFLEKDSGNGPFVRLDFENRTELIPWLSSKSDRKDKGSFLLATFNDTKIEVLHLDKD